MTVTPGLAWTAAATAIVALTWATPASSTSGDARRSSAGCAPQKADVLAGNRHVRVYKGQYYFYACSRETGRRVRLGPPPTDDLDLYFLRRFRLRGKVVAFALTHNAYRGRDVPGESSDRIVVRNVRRNDGASRYEAQDRRGPYDDAVSRPGVSDLVVDRRGRVAWITVNPYGSPTTIEVYKQDSGGRALLDQGDAIDRASLRLRDGKVRWRNGGAERTAPFG